jgi:tRNA (guanine37-N1)-methyltransferase
VVGRAQERGLLAVHGWNPRDYATDAYRRVDERPFGGGPGMVMLIDPLRDALRAARAADAKPARTIYLSPQGTRLTQDKVRELAREERLILLCGRYEAVDERLIEHEVDEEISIGDAASAQQDSFSDGLLDCPHFTRPLRHEFGEVPPVLLSGDHAAIAKWRRKQALGRTWQRRPDLLARVALKPEENLFLLEFQKDTKK